MKELTITIQNRKIKIEADNTGSIEDKGARKLYKASGYPFNKHNDSAYVSQFPVDGEKNGEVTLYSDGRPFISFPVLTWSGGIEILDGKKFQDSRMQECDRGWYHVCFCDDYETRFLSKHRKYERAVKFARKAAKKENARFLEG